MGISVVYSVSVLDIFWVPATPAPPGLFPAFIIILKLSISKPLPSGITGFVHLIVTPG